MNIFSKLFYIYLFLFVVNVFGQQITIKGKITDSIFKPIPRASIVASYSKNETNIIAYSTSKKDGSFVLNFKEDSAYKEFWISFRHLSYGAKTSKYKNISQDLKVALKSKTNLLEEVVLKAKKVLQIKGDTITYKVTGIQKEKDYTIEEVINRIPGVKINENGQISYNNRIISHFYINGVDLLEGRYNIATRGIPASSVKEIDIMKNHNHSRIDKGITDSEDVAFNLKIKKDHSLVFGSAKADIGTPFFARNLEVTPIYLKENFQDIASGKTNNIGNSLENNGMSLTLTNSDFIEMEINPPNILSPPNTSGTFISNKYWLDNNSFSVTNDALIKSGGDLILKAGANYSYNDNRLNRSSTQRFFFDTDTTLVDKVNRNEITKKNYYLGLVQEINKDKLYLKNRITINGQNSKGGSKILQNGNLLNYLYKDDVKSIKNLTEFKTKINNRIINSGLLLKYIRSKEGVNVTPSVFNDVILSNNKPEQTNQNINVKQFSLGVYSAYNFQMGKLKSQLKQRVNWSRESLISNLAQFDGTMEEQLIFPFRSDFRLNIFESISNLKSTVKFKDLMITLKPSFKYIHLNKVERFSPVLNRRKNYLFFQPRATIRYKIDHQWNISTVGSYVSSVSRFSELFNSIILKDYSNLYRNPEEINVTRNIFGILKYWVY